MFLGTSQWLTFFTKAGLPPTVAANYALIFSDNRIQLDMLMDLSKEYLYDMGIRVMGDVIAILRYAKEFHTQVILYDVYVHICIYNVAYTPSAILFSWILHAPKYQVHRSSC